MGDPVWFAAGIVVAVLGYFLDRYISGADEGLTSLRQEVGDVDKESIQRDDQLHNRVDSLRSYADNNFVRKARYERFEERLEKKVDRLIEMAMENQEHNR